MKKSARCNHRSDCPDHSDENHCEILSIPKGYTNYLPPPSKNTESTPVLMSFECTSIRDFNLVGFSVTLDIIERLGWSDPRLTFRNLRPGIQTNKVKDPSKIWFPQLYFEDDVGTPSEIIMRHKTILVDREGTPLPDNPSLIEEGTNLIKPCLIRLSECVLCKC